MTAVQQSFDSEGSPATSPRQRRALAATEMPTAVERASPGRRSTFLAGRDQVSRRMRKPDGDDAIGYVRLR